jgi:hypothetical protein
MEQNPYEAPTESGTPPPRDYSLIISIVVWILIVAALALILIPVSARA